MSQPDQPEPTTTPEPIAVPAPARQLLAEWIFDAYTADAAGPSDTQQLACAAVSQAATGLHTLLAEAGIDLGPELDALSDHAAKQAFSRYS